MGGARTRDLGLKRALLYLLSYHPKKMEFTYRIFGNVGVLYKKTYLCPIFFIFPIFSFWNFLLFLYN